MEPRNPQHSLTQAAERLNTAIIALEQRLHQPSEPNVEIDLLEKENMRLHEENQGLRELLELLDVRLEMSILQMEELMRGKES
jgi:hypothetical protein